MQTLCVAPRIMSGGNGDGLRPTRDKDASKESSDELCKRVYGLQNYARPAVSESCAGSNPSKRIARSHLFS